MMTNKEILKYVQRRGKKENYAVRVWTRDEVEMAHMELIAKHMVYPQPLSDEEKDEILKLFQAYGDSDYSHEMTWRSLKQIIIDFSEERDDYEIGIGLR
jgi:hypothetical protein